MILSIKTTQNSMWNIFGFIFMAVVTFFTTPLFISLLGVTQYGLYVLFQSIMAWAMIMGLGIGPAMIKYVAENIGDRNYKKVNQYINTTLFLNFIIGIISMGIIILIAYPVSFNILKISIENRSVALHCFYWTALGLFLSQFLTTFKSISSAFQNFKFTSIGTALSFGTMTFSALGVLYMGGDLVNVIQAKVVAIFISTLVWLFFVKRFYPNLKLKLQFHANLFRETIVFGGWQTVANLGGVIYSWFDRIIVSIFLPASAIGYYNVPVMICSKGHTGFSQIGKVFFPLTSHLQGKNERERMYKYLTNGSWIVGLLSVAIYVPLALFGNNFLSLWISPEFSGQSENLFFIVILAHIFLSTSVIQYYFMAGIGKPNWMALGSLISGIVGLSIMVILIPKFGLVGAGWSFFSTVVSGVVTAGLIKTKIFPKKNKIKFIYFLYGPSIIGVILALMGLKILPKLMISSWLVFIFYFIITGVLTATIVLITDFVLFRSERRIDFLMKIAKNVFCAQK